MAGRCLLMVTAAMLALSLAVAEENTTSPPVEPVFPEGNNFYFDIDLSDPLYDEITAEAPVPPRRIPAFPQLLPREKITTRNIRNICGRRNSRIYNGEETEPNEYPWQVWLVTLWTDRRAASCGGSIISSQWVMTAAHCLSRSNIPVTIIRVTVGAHDRLIPGTTGGYNVYASAYAIHWNYGFPAYDIALIHLQQPLTLSRTVMPVCLPPSSWVKDDFVNEVITVSGWGRTEEGTAPRNLRDIETKGVSLSTCRSVYGQGLSDTVLCTDGTKLRKVCYGDSGGPAMIERNRRMYQVGVVSFTGSCSSTRPDGHCRVARMVGWIWFFLGYSF
ncbi:chymotrypsin-like elastase family member 2A [Panulirus ornatus]|uniref:chymotrypsin-like elastase family member 2A n=1 Tax=Panulirus ornatus TaxID=150431 RepID=UPI003A837D31